MYYTAGTMVQEDQMAPKFTAMNQYGKKVSLTDFLGKWVVVYFYPKDNTPGCTKEAIDFSVHLEELSKRNAVVLGVSTQAVDSHKSFAQQFHLAVVLLADVDAHISRTYGVLKDSGTADRVTVAIDPIGVVRKVWTSVKVDGHISQVLEYLDSQHTPL